LSRGGLRCQFAEPPHRSVEFFCPAIACIQAQTIVERLAFPE
jgi:hypothetical protein